MDAPGRRTLYGGRFPHSPHTNINAATRPDCGLTAIRQNQENSRLVRVMEHLDQPFSHRLAGGLDASVVFNSTALQASGMPIDRQGAMQKCAGRSFADGG